MGTRALLHFVSHTKLFEVKASGLHLLHEISGNSSAVWLRDIPIQGAYSTTFFNSMDSAGNRQHFLGIANFWNLSGGFDVNSSVFRLVPASENNTAQATTSSDRYDDFSLELVHQISTAGARRIVQI